MKMACTRMLAAGKAQDLTVTHTDLCSNDWSSFIRVSSHPKDRHSNDRVFVSIRTGSLQSPLFPSASIQLGYSAMATHRLSAIPEGRFLDSFQAHCATPSAAKDKWGEQANDDWKEFLKYRADELVVGGQFVHMAFARFVFCIRSERVLGSKLPDEKQVKRLIQGEKNEIRDNWGHTGFESLFDLIRDALIAAVGEPQVSLMTFSSWFRSEQGI